MSPGKRDKSKKPIQKKKKRKKVRVKKPKTTNRRGADGGKPRSKKKAITSNTN